MLGVEGRFLSRMVSVGLKGKTAFEKDLSGGGN